MISDVTYTEEEEALSVELCDAINADKELQKFFRERLGSILREFAEGVVTAAVAKDRQSLKKQVKRTGEMIKGLAMHMHVKVMVKKKDSPSLN